MMSPKHSFLIYDQSKLRMKESFPGVVSSVFIFLKMKTGDSDRRMRLDMLELKSRFFLYLREFKVQEVRFMSANLLHVREE